MADNKFIAQSPTEIPCYNNGSNITVLQVKAPIGISIKILGWSISFDGVSVTSAPIQVMLSRQSTAGTMTATSAVKIQNVPETVQSTVAYQATSEPISGDIFDSFEIHPQAGIDIKYPEDEKPIIEQGSYVGIIVNSSESVNCRVKMICEE